MKPNDPSFIASQAQVSTELLWDEWGVPHIYAKNNNELFYTFGYAQMHSHANTILKNYAYSRGRAAEYFGAKSLPNDMMVHAFDFPATAEKWFTMQTPEFKEYISQFVKGMNDYATQVPGAILARHKSILPIERDDILRHALFVIYSRFVGGNDIQGAARAAAEKGSNTYAIGPSKSASGNAMLVMNPHLPWFDEWLFYEGHFNAPGINMYGATLVGLPTLGIAFNEYLGWSHTNNTIDNADTYVLKMDGAGYVVDGKTKAFSIKKKTLKIKDEAGVLQSKEVDFLSSEDFGHVVSVANDTAYSVKMPGFDRPYGIVQWWEMASAKNLNEFKSALKKIQIPFFNVMYADKAGNIFYLFNGQIPRRPKGDWNFWSGMVDGTKSENIWSEILTYDELPKLENPETGWLQNANDPPWTSTYPTMIDPKDYKPYVAPIEMGFRPTRAVRMLLEDDSISFDELVAYKNSTRIEMADRFLDDLDKAVSEHGNETATAAMKVLNKWDRQADANSKGMALFYQWARKLGINKSENFSKPWSLNDAFYSRQNLTDPIAAVRALEEVAQNFIDKGTALDVAWGDVYRIKYNDKDLPGNGAEGSVGIFRVAWAEAPKEDGISYISGGDSWQSVIEFGDKVRAKVLMSYGNSTQPGSRNNGDQLELFAKKEMRDCYFYKSDVLKNLALKEVLVDGRFVVRK